MLQCRFSGQGIFQDSLKPVQLPLKSVLLHFHCCHPASQLSSAHVHCIPFPAVQTSGVPDWILAHPSVHIQTISLGYGSYLYPNFILEALSLAVVILLPLPSLPAPPNSDMQRGGTALSWLFPAPSPASGRAPHPSHSARGPQSPRMPAAAGAPSAIAVSPLPALQPRVPVPPGCPAQELQPRARRLPAAPHWPLSLSCSPTALARS